jgi:DNA-binding XRE family transcriptional regulator
MSKQASQSVNRGGLELPEEVQRSSSSWLRDLRVAAGFQTPETFAQRVGVSTDSIRVWEAGKAVPLWERLHAIAEVLKCPDEEVVEGIWNEKVEDPCPCDCGGKMVLPDPSQWPSDAVLVDFDINQLRHARMLPIMLPCKCGKTRVYLHRKLGATTKYHRPRCPSCSRLVDRKRINCVGFQLPYFDRRQKLRAMRCERRPTIFLTPSEIRKQQRKEQHRTNLSQEAIDRARRNNEVFFDLASQERRCPACVRAAKVWMRRLKAVQSLEPTVRITTMKQLNDRFREQRKTAAPSLKTKFSPTDQERGRKTYIERCKTVENWPEMTKGCMLRRWGKLCVECKHNPHAGKPCAERNCTCTKYTAAELPSTVRFGVCVWCWNQDVEGCLIITKDRWPKRTPNMFHGPCYREWRKTTDDGRHFISRKRHGEHPNLPAYKPGDRPDEGTLKTRWSWFWQHFAGGMSYPEIAKQASFGRRQPLDPSTIQKAVKYMIDRFPETRLLADQYGREIDVAKSLCLLP